MKKRMFFALGLSMSMSLFAARSTNLDEKIFLDPHVSDVSNKTTIVSLNIGSSLPSTTHIVSTDLCKEIGLGAHFKNMAQKMEENTTVIVTAPASYGVVFADGSISDEAVHQHIEQVLAQIGENANAEEIKKNLNQLSEVCRASFVQREGRLALVRDERQLRLGEQIWRKTPEGVENSVYHSEEEYLVAFATAGFTVEEIKRPCFFGELKYKMHRSSLKEGEKGLGSAYIENHPFTIYYLVKKA